LLERIYSQYIRSEASSNVLVPSTLLFVIWNTLDCLSGYQQQDAHEFFISFLDGLDRHLRVNHGSMGTSSSVNSVERAAAVESSGSYEEVERVEVSSTVKGTYNEHGTVASSTPEQATRFPTGGDYYLSNLDGPFEVMSSFFSSGNGGSRGTNGQAEGSDNSACGMVVPSIRNCLAAAGAVPQLFHAPPVIPLPLIAPANTTTISTPPAECSRAPFKHGSSVARVTSVIDVRIVSALLDLLVKVC
jgi:hypothetical protein